MRAIRGRRGTTLAAAVAVLAGGGTAAAQAAPLLPQPASVRVVTSGDDRGPVDLRRTSLVQEGDELVWRVLTAHPWKAADLRAGAGRRICLSTHRRDDRESSRLCVGWNGQRLRARLATIGASGQPLRWTASAARVRRIDGRTIEVRGPIAALGHRLGPVRWSASSQWTGGDACPDAGDCRDRAPARGVARYEVRRPVPVGCTPQGPLTVRQAPPRSEKEVALTFDDGPWLLTGQFLDRLAQLHVPATFFMIGRQVEAQAPLLRRMLRDGHALGNHTWSHQNVAGGNAGQISSTSQAIERATGSAPCVFRPPGGATSATLAGQVRSLGMVDVLWSVDTDDWRGPPSSDAIVARALAVQPGGIVLMHDGGGPRGNTLAALPRIVSGLRARGYRLVTVPQLLRLPQRFGYRRVGA
ncbi:polysaccharide deacetylase family protein [Patulibacter defluvii]|uniref:polysaccharide deacetylase family protein n=1 Tax=Patulibacter defluvii TaxID=3095358 RepID=UPI002A74ADA1|nr:polysaccharide deacetylase family protein [Patulibacter sp. DM4]